MTTSTLRGLSWGHRRATGPLEPLTAAFQKDHPAVTIGWTVRPLADFEHQGIAQVARDYDIIIFDHPFCGAIVEAGCFLPLDAVFGAGGGLARAEDFLGPSLLSYRFGGTTWGLPVDAATQHAVYRAGLLQAADLPVPQSWSGALALGPRLARRGLKLGLAVHTPHALMTIASLMANLGAPWETCPDRPFAIGRAAFAEAFDAVRAVLEFCPREALTWNAIDLHGAMSGSDAIAYCPAVHGYGTFGEADMRQPLAFAPFAGLKAPYHAGSVLGGTGFGISRFTRHPGAALSFVAFSASPEAQCGLMASRHGQPAHAAAWQDAAIDRRFNGFFTAARQSIETAWIRPRTRGYVEFQARAGAIVAQALAAGGSAGGAYAELAPLIPKVNA